MNDITAILHQLEEGRLSTEEAAEKIRAATAPASSHTDIDYGRLERTGCPEVIYGAGKTPDQIEEIARGLLAAGQNVLATRLNVEALDYLNRAFPEADMHPEARLMRIMANPVPQTEGFVGIVSAGTSAWRACTAWFPIWIPSAGPPCWWLWQAWKERFPACWPGW